MIGWDLDGLDRDLSDLSVRRVDIDTACSRLSVDPFPALLPPLSPTTGATQGAEAVLT